MINCAGGAKIQGCVYLPETGLNWGTIMLVALVVFLLGHILLDYTDGY